QSDLNPSVVKKTQKNIIKKSLITIAISSVIILFCGTLMFVMQENLLGAVFIALGSLFLIVIIILSKKSVFSQKEYKVFFDFDEDLIKITSFENNEIASVSKVFYKDLEKIEEREDYILIYINKINYFILEKSKMVEGNFSELRTFLYGKLNTKYKLMCKV
ncbi:MAG TPA: YcxB family protein, partial [Clostridia bacterium]